MKFIDLHIVDDDLAPDSGGEPQRINGVYAIAQDIKHMIRERGFSIQMIGERDRSKIQLLQVQMQREIENDQRIIPGTVSIERLDTGNSASRNRAQFSITANTTLGKIEVSA